MSIDGRQQMRDSRMQDDPFAVVDALIGAKKHRRFQNDNASKKRPRGAIASLGWVKAGGNTKSRYKKCRVVKRNQALLRKAYAENIGEYTKLKSRTADLTRNSEVETAVPTDMPTE